MFRASCEGMGGGNPGLHVGALTNVLADPYTGSDIGRVVDTNFRAANRLRKGRFVGAWLSLVEHLVRDQGVGGSNPLAPTNLLKNLRDAAESQLCHL